MTDPIKAKTRKLDTQNTKVKKGQVALFTDGVIITGDCTWVGIKADKNSKEAFITIYLTKSLS